MAMVRMVAVEGGGGFLRDGRGRGCGACVRGAGRLPRTLPDLAWSREGWKGGERLEVRQ